MAYTYTYAPGSKQKLYNGDTVNGTKTYTSSSETAEEFANTGLIPPKFQQNIWVDGNPYWVSTETFYAVFDYWTISGTIKYYPGDTLPKKDSSIKAIYKSDWSRDTTSTYMLPTTSAITGYEHWYTNGSVSYIAGTYITCEPANDYYWTSFYKYTINFDANGGSGSMNSQSFVKGTSQTLSKNTFTNGTKSFLGWGTSASSTTVKYTDEQSVTQVPTDIGSSTSTITLYAVWGESTTGPKVKISESWVDSTPYIKVNDDWTEPWMYVKAEDTWNLIHYPQYTYLTYIQLNDGAYINTNYIPSINTSIDTTFALTSISTSTVVFYGSATNWYSNAIEGFIEGGTTWTCRSGADTGNTHTLTHIGDVDTNKKRYLYTGGASGRTWILYNEDGSILENATFPSTAGSSITAVNKLFIGALNREDGLITNTDSWKLYSFKITDTAGTQREFIPVAKNNSDETCIYGLLDKQNNIFYSNANSSGNITGA